MKQTIVSLSEMYNNDHLQNKLHNAAKNALTYQNFCQLPGADIIALTTDIRVTGIGVRNSMINRGPDGNMWAYAIMTGIQGGSTTLAANGFRIGKLKDYVTYEFVCKEMKRFGLHSKLEGSIMDAEVSLARVDKVADLGPYASLLSIVVKEGSDWEIRNATSLKQDAPFGNVKEPKVLCVEQEGVIVERQTRCMSGPIQGVPGIFPGVRVDRPLFMTVALYSGLIRCSAIYCSTTLCHYGKPDPDSCFIAGTVPDKWWSAQCCRSNEGIQIMKPIDQHSYVTYDPGHGVYQEEKLYPGEKRWEGTGFAAISTPPQLMSGNRYVLAIETMSALPAIDPVVVASPECFPSDPIGDYFPRKSVDLSQLGIYTIALLFVLIEGSTSHICEAIGSTFAVMACLSPQPHRPFWPRALASAGFAGGSLGGVCASTLAFGLLCLTRMAVTANLWATATVTVKSTFGSLKLMLATLTACPALSLISDFGRLNARSDSAALSASLFTTLSGLMQGLVVLDTKPWLLVWCLIQVLEGAYSLYYFQEYSSLPDYVEAQKKLVEAGLGFYGRCLKSKKNYVEVLQGMQNTQSRIGSETVLMTLPSWVGIRRKKGENGEEAEEFYLCNRRVHRVTAAITRESNLPGPFRLFNKSSSAQQVRSYLATDGLEVIPVQTPTGTALFPVC